MTQDEIIRMAREAGFDTKVFNSIDGDEVIVRHGNATSICISDELERFFNLAFTAGAAHVTEALTKAHEDAFQSYVDQAKADRELSVLAAVLAEREACAKVCEELRSGYTTLQADIAATQCVAAIRARGEK